MLSTDEAVMVIRWLEKAESSSPLGSLPLRAAEYVRMSTEHQQYSTDNQAIAIRRYAEQRGYNIVRTYADEGKSGLNLAGRQALQALLNDISSGSADYEVLLVYDVSRWGRFQDPDEAAAYELRCRQAGIQVHYCTEQFENDGSIGSSIIKTVKRAMAGEYSRELSVKVFAGQANLIRLGFRQGGAAGFGLRRMLVDQNGNRKGVLLTGQHKSIATDRVILVPGPTNEVAVIKDIYASFVAGELEQSIAERLNSGAIYTPSGRPWTRGSVHQVLINEKYVGNNVWARTSCKLKGAHVKNDRSQWVRSDAAFDPLIPLEQFEAAQALIRDRCAHLSDDQMLERLSQILAQNGYLSGVIIDEAEACPSSSSFRTRFGSLLRAYTLVGFAPDHDYRYLETNRALRARYPAVFDEVIAGITEVGGIVHRNPSTDLLSINREFTASVIIVRCFATGAGAKRWKLRLDSRLRPDITVAVRMNGSNDAPLDYYVLPQLDMREAVVKLAEYNGLSLDAYRHEALETFYQLCARAHWSEAA